MLYPAVVLTYVQFLQQILAPYAAGQGRLQRSAQGVRPARAAVYRLQGAPAQQGLEGGQEGQLYQVSYFATQ